ncbi:unnamed protein product [Leptosia nina]|uniref:Cuticle protein 16.5-like n=1 Tax=Leptosia nina TaxID=320188 RepID=A0AAV1K364_9NEOP
MISLLVILAVLSAVSADPAVIISNGLLSSPYTSAAYIASPSSPLVVPAVAPVAPVASVPASSVGALPYTAVSDYRYSYGSALSYQDYAPVVSSAALSLPYTLPYAYASDWYYRK